VDGALVEKEEEGEEEEGLHSVTKQPRRNGHQLGKRPDGSTCDTKRQAHTNTQQSERTTNAAV
jgi:hypothetical protein